MAGSIIICLGFISFSIFCHLNGMPWWHAIFLGVGAGLIAWGDRVKERGGF